MTQFIWPTNFACTIITEQIVLPTIYNVSVSIDPMSPKVHSDINTGFKKLRSLVDIRFQNSIFLFQNSPMVETMANAVNNLVVFPTEPYDHFVGCVLYRKFLAITEKYFDIDFITIDSLVGDHVQYSIEHPEESGLELAGDYWWNEDSLDTGSGNDISWDDLNIGVVGPKFEPRVIRGGLSEN